MSWPKRRALSTLLLGGSLGLCAAVAAAQPGCAKGGDETGEDETAGVGGDAGGGGVAGAGGDGGDGGFAMCEEQPCKLVLPQCGCAEGDQCSITPFGERVCQPEGDSAPGTLCENDCTTGHLCVNNGTAQFCHKFCNVDEECDPPGGLCALSLTGGAAKVCSQNCDPVSDVGCKETEPSLKCDLGREPLGAMRWFTRCVLSGTKLQDEVCTTVDECAPGSSCIGVENEPMDHCLTWCQVAIGNCPGAGTHACSGFTTPILIGAIEYGACIPLAGFP